MELELEVYNIRAKMILKNPEEKDLFLSMADDLTERCIKLSMEFRCNIDKTILLFFLLLESKLKKEGPILVDPIKFLFNFLSSISNYIVEKEKLVNQTVEEKLENVNRIRSILIFLILIEKKNAINNSNSDNYEDIETLINNFSKDIKNNIELLKNDLLLL